MKWNKYSTPDWIKQLTNLPEYPKAMVRDGVSGFAVILCDHHDPVIDRVIQLAKENEGVLIVGAKISSECWELQKLAENYQKLCEVQTIAPICAEESASEDFREVKPYDRRYLPQFNNSKNKRRR